MAKANIKNGSEDSQPIGRAVSILGPPGVSRRMESLLPQPLLVVGDTVDHVSSWPGRHHSWSPLLLCLQVPPRSREGGQQERCFFEALRLAGCPPQHPSRLWIPVESGTWLALTLAYPTAPLALGPGPPAVPARGPGLCGCPSPQRGASFVLGADPLGRKQKTKEDPDGLVAVSGILK